MTQSLLEKAQSPETLLANYLVNKVEKPYGYFHKGFKIKKVGSKYQVLASWHPTIEASRFASYTSERYSVIEENLSKEDALKAVEILKKHYIYQP